MSPIRDALDDLVTEVPSHVVPDDLAGTAWRSGRRRRIRKRIAGSVGAVGVVAALVVAILPVVNNLSSAPPASEPGDPGGPGVTSYPQRIGHQWWVRDLPDRPGPAAAVIKVEGGGSWNVVSPGGHRWRLPTDGYVGTQPTISPNGRYVGYLSSDDGPYVIHDLVTGQQTEFAEIGAGLGTIDTRYIFYDQSPSFWSPDGSQISIPGKSRGTHGDGTATRLVLGVDGSLTQVKAEGDVRLGYAAGWASDDELVWVAERRADPADWDSPVEEIVARVTSLDGSVVESVPLSLSSPEQSAERLNQWGAVAQPGGSELLLVEGNQEMSYDDAVVRQFSLSDGSVTAGRVLVAGEAAVCGPGWTGERVTLPVHTDDSMTTVMIDDGQPRSVVATEPGLQTYCIVWAGDALAGEANGGLFGMSTAWWTWWWREIIAGLTLIVIGMAVWWWRRRHRPFELPASRGRGNAHISVR